MSEPTNNPPQSPAAVRKKQLLLATGLVFVTLAVVFGGDLLTDPPVKKSEHKPPRLKRIEPPGGSVEERDSWNGKADQDLREVRKALDEIRGKMADEERRKEKPAKAPADEPRAGTPIPAPPPPPLPSERRALPPGEPPPLPAPGPIPSNPPPQIRKPGIDSDEIPLPKTPVAERPVERTDSRNRKSRDLGGYLPIGFVSAEILMGIDAPTGGQATTNSQPVFLRVVDNAQLANHMRAQLRDCLVIASGWGDISSHRALVRLETLSCITAGGTVIEVPLRGYVAGEDGKAGIRGRLVEKTGQVLANGLLASFAAGIGNAFSAGHVTQSTSPLGTTTSVDPNRSLQVAAGNAVGGALNNLSQYYMQTANKIFPILEIDAGRRVDLVIQQGVEMPNLSQMDNDADEFPALARRARSLP